MSLPSILPEPTRIDEPKLAQGFVDVFTFVASEGKTLIVRRNGEDLAAVMPLEQLALMREFAARHELEETAARIRWENEIAKSAPPQAWFDDIDDPFQPA